MAAPKKKTPKANGTKSGASSGPFKTKRTTQTVKREENVLVPPQDVAEAVDAFREAQDQAAHFEGEATVHKNRILDFAQEEYAKRLYAGSEKGFKVQGIETIAMYVVQDSSAGLSEEDVEAFSERFGKKAADELIVRDFASIRFNDKVLEANYDAVVDALQTLPAEILDNLFKPMAMKARPGAAEKAREHVKNADGLREILRSLKLKNYIR
jgi:hypothetical protein